MPPTSSVLIGGRPWGFLDFALASTLGLVMVLSWDFDL